MDHRAEPTTWLADGSAEGTPGGPGSAQVPTGGPAEEADGLGAADSSYLAGPEPLYTGEQAAFGQDVPYAGQQAAFAGQDGEQAAFGQDVPYAGQQAAFAGQEIPAFAGQEMPGGGDGIRVPPYQPAVPPYPANAPSSPGVAARVTAPFAALTKPKPKAKKSAGPPRSAFPGANRSAAPSSPAPAPPPRGAPARKAQLVLSRIEPWSVMKFSFMISLVGWVILFVAVAALYFVLSKLGVFHSIQSTITDVTSSKGSPGDNANGQWFSASRVLGYTMLVGAINVVLITALATVGAVIYNLVTYLAGGIEVTLKETD